MFFPSKHCGLCRLKLPGPRNSDWAPWHFDTLAVLECTSSNFLVIELPPFLQTNSEVFCKKARCSITIASGEPNFSSRNKIAYRLHRWCYNVLNWKLPECSAATVYQLARIITPLSPTWNALYFDHGLADLQHAVEERLLENFELTPFFGNDDEISEILRKMPREIRLSVWEHVDAQAPMNCFLLVACDLVELVKSGWSRYVPLISPIQSSPLLALTTASINDFTSSTGNVSFLALCAKEPKEIRFAVRVGGVYAVQFLGVDWRTDWYGEVPLNGAWYGSVEFQRSFQNFDDLFQFIVQERVLLWDGPQSPFFNNVDSGLFRLNPLDSAPLLKYVPLYRREEFVTGITFNITETGIAGIQAHFPGASSHLSGKQTGCSIHIAFQHEERIACAWVRALKNNQVQAPALMIQTTFGRVYTVGPYFSPVFETNNWTQWVLLRHQRSITGFYYANPAPKLTITTFGTVDNGEPTAPELELPRYYDCPTPGIANPNVGLFISVALLRDLRGVDFCFKGIRLAGMMAHYNNGQTTVLVQWDPSRRISCKHYNSGVHYSNVVVTKMAIDEFSIVTGIRFVTEDDDTLVDASSEILSLETPIVWWFCEKYDVIEPFEGRYLQVPECNKTSLLEI